MAEKVVAIVGTYRRDHVTETAVDELLRGASTNGAQVEKIMLLDHPIEFCTNCRACLQEAGENRGPCVHDDAMNTLLDKLEAADAMVLASPINFGAETALMKRFIERLVVYGYWPWGTPQPKNRIKQKPRKAVLLVTSACPAFIAFFLMRGAFQAMQSAAAVLGAKVIRKVHIGLVAKTQDELLDEKKMNKAFVAGQKLAVS